MPSAAAHPPHFIGGPPPQQQQAPPPHFAYRMHADASRTAPADTKRIHTNDYQTVAPGGISPSPGHVR